MLQFSKQVDKQSTAFSFQGIRPNAGPNGRAGADLCGQGLCRKGLQKSIDRGMFYVWVDKKGTCRDECGNICVEGNYAPAWVEDALFTYQVFVQWPETLWQQHKLTHEAFDNLLPKCRQNYLTKKRNLDAIRQREAEDADAKEMAENTKRIRGDSSLYRPFAEVPAATAWLKLFDSDALRYPLLVVLGSSGKGKTEWAKWLFKNALELPVGDLTHFPDGLRAFDRKCHDGLILDDIRDMAFVTNHQDKLQGKYDRAVEFASTQGGTCAFTKYKGAE